MTGGKRPGWARYFQTAVMCFRLEMQRARPTRCAAPCRTPCAQPFPAAVKCFGIGLPVAGPFHGAMLRRLGAKQEEERCVCRRAWFLKSAE